MKKTLILFLAILSLTGFYGCTANTPQRTAEEMMASIQAWDTEAMKNTLSADDFYDTADMDTEVMEDAEGTMKLLVSNMTYKITDTKIDGDTAVVTFEITNVNMKPVFSEVLNQIFSLVFSGTDITDEEAQQKVMEYFKTSIETNKADTVTSTVTVQLKKTEGEWTVEKPSDEFFNAVLGNFITAVKEVNESFLDAEFE